MHFHYTNPQTDAERLFGGFYCINAIGAIEPNDNIKFEEFLANAAPPPRTPVYIDSTGGDVAAAIGIGTLIRDAWFSTSIGQYRLCPQSSDQLISPRELSAGVCYSAATLIYVGGRLRYFPEGSKFGAHQFSLVEPQPGNLSRSQVLSSEISIFLSKMDITPDFLQISSATPNSEIGLIDGEKLRALGVVTDGQTDAVWSVQARNRMLYVRGERDSIFGHHKVMLAHIKGQGFFFWAVIEAQGREPELTEFEHIEIVLNGEESRLDISDRAIREVIGLYVNILAPITNTEANEIAHSDSFGVQVRDSEQADMFFGIAAISTLGGKDNLETLYQTLSE